ncbi:MAG: amidohydrolase family protein [Candidatus Latescibacteria bacterium]|nr:amidohydrolase family protein [Candidatus Latescibacterota bacterium]
MNSIYDVEICDCHHHLWDLQANYYPWLTDSVNSRVCGDYDAIQNRNFLLTDFFSNRGDLRVTRFVHEEAVIDRADPVRETRWLQGLADSEGSEGVPHAIVAYADFSQDDIEAILEEHCSYPNTRGIRQFMHEAYIDPENPGSSLLEDGNWREKVGLCARHNLVFDLQIYWQQAEDAVKLVKRHPNVSFVLTHTGFPAHQGDGAYMEGWRSALGELGCLPNLSIKLSGFGMFDRNWTPDPIRPIVMEAIAAFDIDRCMFGSNFPVDSLSGKGYARYWEDFYAVVKGFSDSEKQQLFSENARKIYRV